MVTVSGELVLKSTKHGKDRTFIISEADFVKICDEFLNVNDVQGFLEDYDPKTEGVRLYKYAKRYGMLREVKR